MPITLTDAAVRGVSTLIGRQGFDESSAGLRVGAYRGGCSGYMYDVRVAPAPERGEQVELVNGVRVFMEPGTREMVDGLRVDWVSTLTESRFIYNNPNAVGHCGCGESFAPAGQ